MFENITCVSVDQIMYMFLSIVSNVLSAGCDIWH